MLLILTLTATTAIFSLLTLSQAVNIYAPPCTPDFQDKTISFYPGGRSGKLYIYEIIGGDAVGTNISDFKVESDERYPPGFVIRCVSGKDVSLMEHALRARVLSQSGASRGSKWCRFSCIFCRSVYSIARRARASDSVGFLSFVSSRTCAEMD